MNKHKNKAKTAFWRAVHNKPQTRNEIDRVSKMIKKDRPTLELRPPTIGHSIDAQSFNARWTYDVKTHQQIRAAKTNSAKDPLTTQFNRRSDPLDQITDKKRDQGLTR